MRQGMQTFFEQAGKSACYALCIIELGERVTGKTFNVVDELINAVNKHWMHYNWQDKTDDDNFWVIDPARFLSYLTGKKYKIEHQPTWYEVKEGQLVVDLWKKQPHATGGHFRLHDWDSLQDSQTVKYGEIVGYRVFTEVKK